MAPAESMVEPAVVVPKSTVESAIDALLKYRADHSSNEKLQLIPQDDFIYLNLTLKKIPSNPRTNPYRIPLSFPLLDPASELCLIIDDRPGSPTPPSDQIKKLIKSHNIPVSKVIRISKLKANYKPFEAKRKLCHSYDMFLVDKRIVHLLPKLIGKEFFKKKKLPLGVDLSKSNLKSQVEKALGSALLFFRSGTCCVMKVGKVAMERDEIVENVIDVIKGAVQKVPKKWDGVRSMHLKFCDSVVLPIYQAMPDIKLKIEGLKEIEGGDQLVRLSDNEGQVSDGMGEKSEVQNEKKKKKGRIDEVRYMDVGVDNVEHDDDGLGEIEQAKSEDIDALLGEKGIEGDFLEEIDDEEEGEDLIAPKTARKKRNNAQALKEGKHVDGEKRVKKKAKLEKVEDKKSKKGGLSSGEVSGGVIKKKKNSLGKNSNEGIVEVKDTKRKKRTTK